MVTLNSTKLVFSSLQFTALHYPAKSMSCRVVFHDITPPAFFPLSLHNRIMQTCPREIMKLLTSAGSRVVECQLSEVFLYSDSLILIPYYTAYLRATLFSYLETCSFAHKVIATLEKHLIMIYISSIKCSINNVYSIIATYILNISLMLCSYKYI